MTTFTSIGSCQQYLVLLLLCYCLILSCIKIRSIDAFANHMTEAEYCDRDLQQGVVIMGKIAAYEEVPTRRLRIVNNNVEIKNLTAIDCLKPTFVYMEPKLYHMILDVQGASFDGGSCGGRRTTSNGAALIIPTEPTTSGAQLDQRLHYDIRVVGGWAKTYKEGVRLLDPLYFFCSNFAKNADLNEHIITSSKNGGEEEQEL